MPMVSKTETTNLTKTKRKDWNSKLELRFEVETSRSGIRLSSMNSNNSVQQTEHKGVTAGH